jgi:trans-aconitate methyltransferase
MEQQWSSQLYIQRHDYVWKVGSALIALLDPNPDDRLLDLGCGTGELTE